MSSAVLRVERLSRRYGAAKVLDAVSLTAGPGDLLVLRGPNGSGKSTLLNCIAGIDLEYAGSVWYRDVDLRRMPAWRRVRLGIRRMFQFPHLFEDMTVAENILMGIRASCAWPAAYARRWRNEDEVERIADEMGLLPLLSQKARALSLGEMKLLNLARAFAGQPETLLLDEPLASLSRERREAIVDSIVRRARTGGVTVVAEHVVEELRPHASAMLDMSAGRLHQ